MFEEVDPRDHTPASLRAAYARVIAAAIDDAGVETVQEVTDLDRERIESLAAGDPAELTLAEAARILATGDGRDADALLADARDRLLLSMSSAVMDVDALSRELDGAATPKELQQRIEGRRAMTLAEYAELSAVVARER